jgi:uncharacterized protein (TIGR02599 family)
MRRIKLPPTTPRDTQAFTLVEVMVSTALVVLIMAMLLTTVDQTQRIWSRSRARVSQFQSARNAFESMTRQLSQATLNTYYDVEYRTGGAGGLTPTDPVGFFRQSELHFVSGPAAQPKLLDGDQDIYPTHAVFFQAPVGYSSPASRSTSTSTSLSNNRDANSLLSAVGYYIKWGEDEDRPSFISLIPSYPKRYRYRLMQLQQPSEGLGLFYNFFENPNPPGVLTKTTGWIKTALNPSLVSGFPSAKPHTLAENVVALVLVPKLAEKDRTSPDILDLAPDYNYDSRPAKADGTLMRKTDLAGSGNIVLRKQFNQLPPIMQVTMIALDEDSGARLQSLYGNQPAPLTRGLFDSVHNEDDIAKDIGTAKDLSTGDDSLIRRLIQGVDASKPLRATYRIYTTDVVLRGSKWSADS